MTQTENFTEQQMTGGRDPQSRGIFAGVALVFMLVVVVGFGLMLFLHFRWTNRIDLCRSTFRDVPGLTIIEEDAMPLWQVDGPVIIEFETAAAVSVVEQSMNQHYAMLMREGIESGDLRNRPTRSWTIEATENGTRVSITCE